MRIILVYKDTKLCLNPTGALGPPGSLGQIGSLRKPEVLWNLLAFVDHPDGPPGQPGPPGKHDLNFYFSFLLIAIQNFLTTITSHKTHRLFMPECLKTGLAKIRTHSTTWQLKTIKLVQRPIKSLYLMPGSTLMVPRNIPTSRSLK